MSKINFTYPIALLLALTLLWLGSGWSAAGAQPAFKQVASATVTPTTNPTSSPTPTDEEQGLTLTATYGPTPTLTPLPAKYIETPDQTTGIMFGAVFLLVIIVGGTFITIRSRR